MYHANFTRLLAAAAVGAASLGGIPVVAMDCCEEEDFYGQEELVAERHLHFSNQDVDIYDQTPDTVYRDADWPSKIEEYSDYLSR